MNPPYWHRQESDQPLFPQLEWSRPENRQQAGKLLIIGGNSHGFAAPAEAYTLAQKAGIGTTRVLLPDALRKVVGPLILEGEFTASTPSGSFSQRALVDVLDFANWSDATLFSGDLGRNAETAILVEKTLQKSSAPITITKDAADYIIATPHTALTRTRTTLIISFSQLQKITIAAGFEHAITFSMDLLRIVEWLHIFTVRYPVAIITKHLDTVLCAYDGSVSTTRLRIDIPIWRTQLASYSTVWQLQNPSKQFEAMTTGVFVAIASKHPHTRTQKEI